MTDVHNTAPIEHLGYTSQQNPSNATVPLDSSRAAHEQYHQRQHTHYSLPLRFEPQWQPASDETRGSLHVDNHIAETEFYDHHTSHEHHHEQSFDGHHEHYSEENAQGQEPTVGTQANLVYSVYDFSGESTVKGRSGPQTFCLPTRTHVQYNMRPHLAVIQASNPTQHELHSHAFIRETAGALPSNDPWRLPHHVFPEVSTSFKGTRSDSWPGKFPQMGQLQHDSPHHHFSAMNSTTDSTPHPPAGADIAWSDGVHQLPRSHSETALPLPAHTDHQLQALSAERINASQFDSQDSLDSSHAARLWAWNNSASVSQVHSDQAPYSSSNEPNVSEPTSGEGESSGREWWGHASTGKEEWNTGRPTSPLPTNLLPPCDLDDANQNSSIEAHEIHTKPKVAAKRKSKAPDSTHSGEAERHSPSSGDCEVRSSELPLDDASREVARRRYTCNLCVDQPKSFARPSALKIHMLTHTKLKPHVCSECQRCFSIPSNLTRHRRLHGVDGREGRVSRKSKKAQLE